MKIIFIGCVEFSHSLLEHLLKNKRVDVVGIITKQSSFFNADFKSLGSLASEFEIPCYIDEKNNQTEMAIWIKNLCPDVIYCFGWPFLLKKELIKLTRLGVIGYHPTKLPLNRGRHPIIWALVLGLTETSSTFFFMDDGADSGDILHQESVKIGKHEDAWDIYFKLLSKAKCQMTEFTNQFIDGEWNRIPQDDSKANSWRKRSKADGEIDWRMSTESIYNLVRALTKPYAGAHCLYKGSEVKIWKTKVICSGLYTNIEPGRVLASEHNMVTIKCGDGAIKIVQHEFDELPKIGTYL